MRKLRTTVGERTAAEDGAISILTAALLAGLIAATSLAVDVGRVAYVSRDLQGATDRAALDAASVLVDPSPTLTETCARVWDEVAASLARNDASVGVAGADHGWFGEVGRIEANGELDVFCSYDGSEGSVIERPIPPYPTAVRVTTDNRVDYLFTLSGGGRDLDRIATALVDLTDLPPGTPTPIPIPGSGTPTAVVQAGSTTASLRGGVVEELVRTLLDPDGEVALDLIGWRGMATAMVRLGALATELGVGTVEELADVEVTVEELLRATIQVLQAEGDAVEAQVLTDLGVLADASAGLTTAVRLGDLLRVETSEREGADASVDAFGLFLATAQAANRANALDVTAMVPGAVAATLTIVEPPVIAAGRVGTTAETAQAELELRFPLAGELDLGGGLTVPLLAGTELVVRVTAGEGHVTISDIGCGDDRSQTSDVTGAAASARLDPVTLVDVDVLGVVHGTVGLGGPIGLGSAAGTAAFEGPFPVDPEDTVVVGATDLALGTALASSLDTLVTADLWVWSALPLPGGYVEVPEGDVTAQVAGLLEPVVEVLDDEVEELLSVLGVQVGNVEVRGLDVLGCDGRWLVRTR
jgi:uncharacterized membrane protein